VDADHSYITLKGLVVDGSTVSGQVSALSGHPAGQQFPAIRLLDLDVHLVAVSSYMPWG